MTNAEKFKEVFGLEIDEMPADVCDIVDHNICIEANTCTECPAHHFWDKTYKGNEGMKQKIVEGNKSFRCGIEESGFHAYNCNDCPNKCEEYYQWDKEMKGE